ncbi:hypothetical protein, partial [Pseudonocardia halophobica]
PPLRRRVAGRTIAVARNMGGMVRRRSAEDPVEPFDGGPARPVRPMRPLGQTRRLPSTERRRGLRRR